MGDRLLAQSSFLYRVNDFNMMAPIFQKYGDFDFLFTTR